MSSQLPASQPPGTQKRLAPLGLRCALLPLTRGGFFVQGGLGADRSRHSTDREYVGDCVFDVARLAMRDVVTARRASEDAATTDTGEIILVETPFSGIWVEHILWVEDPSVPFDFGAPVVGLYVEVDVYPWEWRPGEFVPDPEPASVKYAQDVTPPGPVNDVPYSVIDAIGASSRLVSVFDGTYNWVFTVWDISGTTYSL